MPAWVLLSGGALTGNNHFLTDFLPSILISMATRVYYIPYNVTNEYEIKTTHQYKNYDMHIVCRNL